MGSYSVVESDKKEGGKEQKKLSTKRIPLSKPCNINSAK